MKDASIDIQKTVLAALLANTSLTAVVTGVFDSVPDNQATPFLTIGDISSEDDSTKAIPGQVHTVTLHVWDESESRLLTRQIIGMAVASLHDTELTVPGDAPEHKVINSRTDGSSAVFKDPDGRTQHGVVRFRIVSEQIV